MKLIIRLLIAAVLGLGLTNTVNAAGQGAYMGFNVGTTNTHNVAQPINVQTTNAVTGAVISNTSVLTNASNNGFGFRIFSGYNFNPYFALEGGWAHYGASKYNPSIGAVCNSSSPFFVTPCNSPTIRTNGFDFEGKGIAQLPFFGLGVFVKLGFAALQVSYAGSMTSNNVSQNGAGSSIQVRPLAGVGVNYDLTQNWQFDLSATKVMSSGSTFQSADFVSLGISYHFVDAQCGQFLC